MFTKRLTTLATIALLFTSSALFAQVKIGDNPTTINSSSVLDVESTNKGFLPPRLTSTQRDAITTPASGLVIYNITDKCLQINTGTPAAPVWECSSVKSGGDAVLRFSGNRAYSINSNYNTILNQEVSIPNSSYNFTTVTSGTLTLTYSAFLDWSGIGSGLFQHVEYRLYIDNVLAGSQSFEHNSAEAASINITGFKSITQGSHTVELRAFQLAGGPDVFFKLYQNSYYASIQ